MTVAKPLKLSVSAIKTYEQCPRKYFYNYIERPDVEKVPWPHLQLGLFLHDVLEGFHNILLKDDAIEWPDLMSVMCKRMVKKYNLTKEQKGMAKEMLKNYLGKLDKNGLPNVVANEEEFYFNIDDDVIIRGFIDRIDLEEKEDGKRYEVVDYKSGSSRYLDEFQLLVYGVYLLHKYPDLELFKGTYIVLSEECKSISYNFTNTDVNRVRDKIIRVANEIKTDQTWEPKPQFLCKYCDYNKICPASPHKEASNARRDW